MAKVVDDPEVIGLVRRWLRAGVLTASGVQPGRMGTPQGGVISPLLANIYLHRLDSEVRAAGFRLIRYADDFVVLANRRWKVEAADRLVRAILADIGLEVAETKSGIVAVRDGFEFLGFTFHGRFLRPRPRALARFKDEVRQRTRRQAPVSLGKMIEQLNPRHSGLGQLLQSWRRDVAVRGSRQVDPHATAFESHTSTRHDVVQLQDAQQGLAGIGPREPRRPPSCLSLARLRAQPWVSRMR